METIRSDTYSLSTLHFTSKRVNQVAARIEYLYSVKCVALTNDNHQVLAGAHCAKDQLKAWNTVTETCLHTYTGHTHAVMCMLLTSGDQFLITGSRDGTIKVWEQASGSLLTSFDLQSQIKHISYIIKF